MDWHDPFCAGHLAIHEHYRRLLDCLHDLGAAVEERRPLRLAHLVSQLKDYLHDHLAKEEARMRACASPRLAEHLARHEDLRSKVASLRRQAADQTLSGDAVIDIRHGLIEHVVRSGSPCANCGHGAKDAAGKAPHPPCPRLQYA